jgi:hypothetical protein
MSESMTDDLARVIETFSQGFIDHIGEHASRLYPRLMRKAPGDYEGKTPCCDVRWRATRSDHGTKRKKALTVTFIDIELPDGKLLFGW